MKEPMPKQARVAIVMASMVIFAVTMLDLVRSRVDADGRAFKSAAAQYTSLKKIYTAPGDSLPGTVTTPQTFTALSGER
jgi:hypothetical protein